MLRGKDESGIFLETNRSRKRNQMPSTESIQKRSKLSSNRLPKVETIPNKRFVWNNVIYLFEIDNISLKQ